MDAINSGLITKDKIEVPTNHGICQIDLLYGSVTKLPQKEEVDVLVVSAFPNNYVETPWSVIGALRRELGISVSDLAKDKEEDLRNIFSCWWSKELPPDKSFRRILCFEGSYKPGAIPTSVISEIFRCLVSLSKGAEIKVMMPLITTGHQGYEYETILSLIVEAAIHWMDIGLQLKVLKIVVYAKDVKQVKSDLVLKQFRTLKQEWLRQQDERKKIKKAQPINYDVYLSYCPRDKPLAERIMEALKALYEDVKIYSERQDIDPEKTWQDHIYEVMVSCARIVTVMNPNFLTDEACLEQYNIALCCSRNMKRDYLAPFYVETIEIMPTYMSLIQYIDCRPVSDGSLSVSCSIVTNWLRSNHPKLRDKSIDQTEQIVQPSLLLVDHYDVFISYSHKNSEAAYQIKQHLSVLYPDWKIFIDVADLKTGVVWQTKLYNSIEHSKIVLCLISPTYISSKVCQEEYNLSMALHCDPAYSTVLFPILVEPVDVLPSWCCDYPPLDLTKASISDFLGKVKLLKELDGLHKPMIVQISTLTEEWRTRFYHGNFPYLAEMNHGAMENIQRSHSHIGKKSLQVVLCYHRAEKSSANFFAKRLSAYLNKPIIQRPMASERGNALIDEADIVILFLSPAFVQTAKLVEEANIALCRQRWSDRLILLPIILETLPTYPAYFKLFLCLFALNDSLWKQTKLPLRTRLSWRCSLSSQSAIFLDNVAAFAAVVASNANAFRGQFKTLLSLQELTESVKRISDQQASPEDSLNPLVFQDLHSQALAAQTLTEGSPSGSHSPAKHSAITKVPTEISSNGLLDIDDE